MALVNKLRDKLRLLRSLPSTLWVNFTCLPLSQAIKLPILLYKPRLLSMSGRIVINGPVYYGMIRLGFPAVSIFPNNGITIENRGTIIFNGKVSMGNGTAISVGTSGRLTLGNGVVGSTGLKVVCYHDINLDHDVRLGWNCMLVDNDFHKITFLDGRQAKGYGPIAIGNNTWLGNGCKIYKNVTIPHHCIVGADTFMHRTVECEPYSLLCGDNHVKVKATGLYRNLQDDIIDFSPTL